MIPARDAASAANLAGALWMVASMAGFAIEDVFLKTASAALPVGQVLCLFGLGGAILFAAIALANRDPLFGPDVLSTPMRVRACFEVTGRLFYVFAIALTPLSSATVILQATPIVVVAGAALIFRERVGWRRWTAILLGLTGVTIIVGPGADSFSPLSILAVIGMIGFAGRDLASRAAPISLSTATLGFYGFLAVIVAGAICAAWQAEAFVTPDPATALALGGAVLAGVAGYAFLMKAMRTGEVSFVTPFRYARLLFGIAFGMALFGETLTPAMLAGSALIVASGLFIMWRGRRLATDDI